MIQFQIPADKLFKGDWKIRIQRVPGGCLLQFVKDDHPMPLVGVMANVIELNPYQLWLEASAEIAVEGRQILWWEKKTLGDDVGPDI